MQCRHHKNERIALISKTYNINSQIQYKKTAIQNEIKM